MQKLILLILAVILFFLSGAYANAGAPPADVIVVGLGESVRVDIENGAQVHISDGGVVRSRVIGRTIMMTGRRTGKTSMRIIGQRGPSSNGDKTIVVTERKIASTARLFQKQIESRRGLKFNPSALPVLIVTGELLRVEDWQDLVTLARETKVPWRLEARIFPSLVPEFRAKLESELTRLAWPGQRLTLDENGPTLTGGTESQSMTAEQKLSVTSLGVQLETTLGLTELEPMIRTQIVIAEVRKTHTRKLGIEWPANGTAIATVPSLQIPTDALILNLQAMEQEGEGRILAMPNLLCRSGGEAKFLAGGEIPIQVATHRTASVEWKKYGITLNVQPKADRMKRMKFQLSTEISTLDYASQIKGLPGILSNKIDTQFNLEGPQTIVLSGLLKREEGISNAGLPVLRNIPILGGLFGSDDYKKLLTELIIFVSPEVIIPGAPEKPPSDASPAGGAHE